MQRRLRVRFPTGPYFYSKKPKKLNDRMNLKNQMVYWVPVYFYAGLVFYLSSIPQIIPPATGVYYSTWILHIIEYFLLSLLLFRALLNSKFRKRALLFAVLIAIIYGITDEFHQLFVQGRSSTWVDVLFDGLGGSLIILPSRKFKKYLLNNRPLI